MGNKNSQIESLKKILMARGLTEQHFIEYKRQTYINLEGTLLTCVLEENRYLGDNMHFYDLNYQGQNIAHTNYKDAEHDTRTFMHYPKNIEEILPDNLIDKEYINLKKAEVTTLQEIITTLSNNIKEKKPGRESWFDQNIDSKVGKLTIISTWLSDKNSLDDTTQRTILALVRDICSIKRNSWGIFQPHSLGEFNDLLKEKKLQAPNNISLKGLEDSNGARIINIVLAQLSIPKDSNLSAASMVYI